MESTSKKVLFFYNSGRLYGRVVGTNHRSARLLFRFAEDLRRIRKIAEAASMATITKTYEETLTFTAKSPQKQINIKLKPTTELHEEQKQTKLLESVSKSYEEQKLVEFQKSESLEERKLNPQLCLPDCEDCKRMMSQLCPPGCEECKKLETYLPRTVSKSKSQTIPLVFNAIGIVIAILASYLIISTDSNLYLVFWVVYSVLRRMMTKSKPRVKSE